jgi:hypothetical protein
VEQSLFCRLSVGNGVTSGEFTPLPTVPRGSPRRALSSVRSLTLVYLQTPMASFALWSPTAFYSPQLNSSKPRHFSSYSTASSPSFGSERPLSPSASLYLPHTPARLPAEPTIAHQVRPGPLVPQRAYSAPFSAGNTPMQVEFQLAGGVPGVPMRLLQDAGSVDLPIEGADNIPFSESVASTITLRIWVSLAFTLSSSLLTPQLYSVAGLCTILSTNDYAKGYRSTYAS